MLKPKMYLLRFGELALKGKNRKIFVDDLIRIVKPRVRHLKGRIEKGHQRLVLHCDAEVQDVKAAMSTVFGLTGISPIWRTSRGLDSVVDLAWQLIEPFAGSGQTFAVKARRGDKHFPMTSMDLQRRVAEALFKRGLDLDVNLSKPQLCLQVKMGFQHAWVSMETWPGLGGLPIHQRSRFGLLLSGGIDSPVAGNLMQKRGAHLDAIYFHTPPFTVEAAKEKVVDLAQILAGYQNRLHLHVVNFTEVMKTLRADCDEGDVVVLSRRFMMRIAAEIMKKIKGHALITGESLGQVASQTIENIAAINHGVPFPILRPLIGMDKREIIGISQRMGAFEASIRPFDDCCSLFSPKHPNTRAKVPLLEAQEQNLDVEGLVQRALEQTEEMVLRPT